MKKSFCTICLMCLVCLAFVSGCKKEPPCEAGTLHSSWQSPQLSPLISSKATVCKVPDAQATSYAKLWIESTVHRANMDNVDAAQDNGWSRTGDNWYSTSGNFNTPKWSTFRGPAGSLKLDVFEAGGGAYIEWRLNSGANAAGVQ